MLKKAFYGNDKPSGNHDSRRDTKPNALILIKNNGRQSTTRLTRRMSL
jgi:hypothetical protein